MRLSGPGIQLVSQLGATNSGAAVTLAVGVWTTILPGPSNFSGAKVGDRMLVQAGARATWAAGNTLYGLRLKITNGSGDLEWAVGYLPEVTTHLRGIAAVGAGILTVSGMCEVVAAGTGNIAFEGFVDVNAGTVAIGESYVSYMHVRRL